MPLLIAIFLPLLIARTGAAPHSLSVDHTNASIAEPGYPLDINNLTSPTLSAVGDVRSFSICGAEIDAPPYEPWSSGEQTYFPYFSYSYKFQDQQGEKTWKWQLWVGPTGFQNDRYSSEHIYELQLIHRFFDDYLVKSPEVVQASSETDFQRRHNWFCRYHIKPKIVNSKDWTLAKTFDGFGTPAKKLSAQLSGQPRPAEMVYLDADLNSLKGTFFGLKVPRDHNHVKDMLEDLAKVSLLAQYLNHETVWKIFGRVSARMDGFYGNDVQEAVKKSQWTLGKKVLWAESYEDFESRFLGAIQRNMRQYRDRTISRAKREIKKKEFTPWLRNLITKYQEPGGPLSDEVFSLEKLRRRT